MMKKSPPTRADADDHLDLTDEHRDLFLGQVVTRAHLRPNIHARPVAGKLKNAQQKRGRKVSRIYKICSD